MFSVIILNAICIISSYFAKKSFKYGLEISFILIFLFSAFRYGYGNDFYNYLQIFNDINLNNVVSYDKSYHVEIGWFYLCKITKPIGYQGLIITISFINCIVLYNFFKKFIDPEFYWLGIFIYTFNPYLFLTYLSAIRQSLTFSFFIISLYFIINKQLLKFVCTILIGSLFHTSILFVLPSYFLSFINRKNILYYVIAVCIIFFIILIYSDNVYDYIDSLVNKYFFRYNTYLDSTKEATNSGMGKYLNYILMFFYLYNLKNIRKYNKENIILFGLSFLGFIFSPLGQIAVMISRIGMYFVSLNIAVYPKFSKDNTEIINVSFILFIIFSTMYYFIQFINNPLFFKYYSDYKTIFNN